MTAASASPVAIKLDAETKARVKRLAEARQRSPHWLMREAIGQYVEREERRESVRRDAIDAWNAYQLTGAHATMEAADAWLARLEGGEDAEPPECQS